MKAVLSLSALLSALLLCGCLGNLLAREAAKVRYYQIDYPAMQPLQEKPYDLFVNFKGMKVVPAYDRTPFIFQNPDRSMGVYSFDEWLSNPAELAGTMLARDLAGCGVFQSLVSRTIGVLPDYTLNSILGEICEYRGENGAQAGITICCTLTRLERQGEPASVILQRDYRAAAPCAGGNAESYAGAVSVAMQKASENFLRDMKEAVEKEEARLRELRKN